MHGIIWWIIVGVIAGWLTGKIMKGSGYGFFVDMILGLVGAMVGGWVAGLLGIAAYGFLATIIIATVGAVLVVFLFRLVTGRS